MADRASSPSTTNNFLIFLFLAFGVVMLDNMFFGQRNAPKDEGKEVAAAPVKPDALGKKGNEGKGEAKKADAKDEKGGEGQGARDEEKNKKKQKDAQTKKIEKPRKPVPEVKAPHWVTLGSADPNSPYRMLVTLTDRGAAVARIELNSPRYPALTDDDGFLAHKGGYLGRIVMEEDKQGKGCPVQVVGDGTPAARAGLAPGDLITRLGGRAVHGAASLDEALARTRPRRAVKIEILRDGKPKTLEAKLTRPPMEVTRPEGADPLSFLLTLAQVDDDVLSEPVLAKDAPKDARPGYVDQELPGLNLNLRNGTWQIARATRDEVEFRCPLPHLGLELVKTYRLAKVPEAEAANADYRAYHLVLEVSIRNVDEEAHAVAYQLDGPTGLPIEGWWYSSKVGLGNCWNAGLRDFVLAREGGGPQMIGCQAIAGDNLEPPYKDKPVDFVGIDAVYFSSVLIPQKDNPSDIWFAGTQPLRVGAVVEDKIRNTNTSCRLWSVEKRLEPGESFSHRYEVFAGPKRPELINQYKLGGLVSYGWFDFAARPMVWLLHAFQYVVHNWGLAIIMLTVLVRGLMFPISRKQALGAQKMAELQPEIKRLQEKYKKDLEARHRAQQELFRKHKYNPLSGCLVMLLQLPIFIGLYRGLMVDVELRGSSLLGSSVRWCSNLAAPDMLFDWHRFMPDFVTSGIGILGLGPYFNLLPILTIILFLVQQKMLMPPPADEQQAMQQNIMKYMMIFMGVLFFKVAAGLCVYFIASSLWGLAERKLLPSKKPADEESSVPATRPTRNGGGSAARSKKGPGRRG